MKKTTRPLLDKLRGHAAKSTNEPVVELMTAAADSIEFLRNSLRIAHTTMADYGIEWAEDGKITKLPGLVSAERAEKTEAELMAVVRTAEAWVDAWDPEKKESFDLVGLRPHCEKMRRLVEELRKAVATRRAVVAAQEEER